MSYYEIIVIYDKEYGEVIAFESNAIMNDSNDIVTEAIRLMLFEEEYRDKVRWAHCVSEYEYEYIEKEKQIAKIRAKVEKLRAEYDEMKNKLEKEKLYVDNLEEEANEEIAELMQEIEAIKNK